MVFIEGRTRPMKFALASLCVALSSTTAAHDMWLQPETFRPGKDTPTATQLYVGHGADRARWGVPNAHVVSFESLNETGTMDQKASLTLGSGNNDAVPVFTSTGTHMLTMTSKDSFSTLAAEKFNDYVATSGITPIADARREAGTENAEGRERYSRRAKAIVKVCEANMTDDLMAATPIGHTLEIIPMVDPTYMADGRGLPLRVLYNGEPVDGATLKITDLSSDEPLDMDVKTSANGTAIAPLPHRGKWLLTTIWSRPLTDDEKADFDTIFASLSFDSLPCRTETG